MFYLIVKESVVANLLFLIIDYNILSILNEIFFFKQSLRVMTSFKNISISLILSFDFRTQKVSQKMYFCSSWYQITKLWLLNWKINVILYQISLFSCILQAIRKRRLLWHTLYFGLLLVFCRFNCKDFKILKIDQF